MGPSWNLRTCHAGRMLALAWLVATASACERVPEEETLTSDGGGEGGSSPSPPSNLCDPVQQSCPAGFKCSAFVEAQGDVRYKCVDELAWYVDYEPCEVVENTTNDGCSKGSACLPSSFLSSMGLCLPLCVAGEGCEASARCLATVGIGVGYCAPTCSPLTPECPIPTMSCLESELGFSCRFESSVNLRGAGQGCGPTTEKLCDEGLVCLYAGLLLECTEASCCAPLCDPEEPGDNCDATTECVPLEAPGYPPGVGACHIPF